MADTLFTDPRTGVTRRMVDMGDGTFAEAMTVGAATADDRLFTDPVTGVTKRLRAMGDGTFAPVVATS